MLCHLPIVTKAYQVTRTRKWLDLNYVIVDVERDEACLLNDLARLRAVDEFHYVAVGSPNAADGARGSEDLGKAYLVLEAESLHVVNAQRGVRSDHDQLSCINLEIGDSFEYGQEALVVEADGSLVHMVHHKHLTVLKQHEVSHDWRLVMSQTDLAERYLVFHMLSWLTRRPELGDGRAAVILAIT